MLQQQDTVGVSISPTEEQLITGCISVHSIVQVHINRFCICSLYTCKAYALFCKINVHRTPPGVGGEAGLGWYVYRFNAGGYTFPDCYTTVMSS